MVGDVIVVDQEAIYARVIGLLVSQRDINFHDVLPTELAAFPPSMFKENGQMRDANNKSTLKQNLAVILPSYLGKTSARFIDGSAALWK